jgi:hypothetical protein
MKKVIFIFIMVFVLLFVENIFSQEVGNNYYVEACIVEGFDGNYKAGVTIINSLGRVECLFAEAFVTKEAAEEAVKTFIQLIDKTDETKDSRKQSVVIKPVKTFIEIEKELEQGNTEKVFLESNDEKKEK